VMVKVRDGQVANRPIYAAVGVTLAGEKDILGLWAGGGGEGAKFWMSVLTELRNRGVKDVFFVVCDGLKGLPEVVGNVWPQAIVQTCIVHLIRNTFHLASKRDWDALRRDVKPICTAVNADAARAALDELAERWGQRYSAIIRLWENSWAEFIPFLDYGACRRMRVAWTLVILVWDHGVWPSRIERSGVISRSCCRRTCGSGCRRIMSCGSCWRRWRRWIPAPFTRVGVWAGLGQRVTTRT
jgi:putative transposase